MKLGLRRLLTPDSHASSSWQGVGLFTPLVCGHDTHWLWNSSDPGMGKQAAWGCQLRAAVQNTAVQRGSEGSSLRPADQVEASDVGPADSDKHSANQAPAAPSVS